MSSEIRDINLAESGEQKIEWVRRNCDLLRMLEEEFSQSKPFAGKKVTLSVHLEAKTAYLCKVLAAGGAEMYVTGSNPLSTQDDVAAALVKAGLEVHAWYGATEEEYNAHIRAVLSAGPNIIIDDGGDLVHMVHTEMRADPQYPGRLRRNHHRNYPPGGHEQGRGLEVPYDPCQQCAVQALF